MGVPSYSNAIKATRRVIKSDGDNVVRLPLLPFLNSAQNELVHEWSMESDQVATVNYKPFHKEPPLVAADWSTAYA